MENTRIKGRISYISPQGYGFISSIEMKFTRIFFHWSSLTPDTLKFTELKKGMHVEFTPAEMPDNKGVRAYKVKVVQPDAELQGKVSQ